MKLTNHEWLRAGRLLGVLLTVVCLLVMSLDNRVKAQAISTTTVQGTVYLANGQPGSGTVVVSWPTFTTASGQMVTADSLMATIAPDGFLSVNLTPNLGATPAGEYYTAVFYLSGGTTNTQYWVVPAGAQVTLGQVQAQLMPAAQAAQAVNKAYVDQAVASAVGSLLTASGGTLTGPLTLSGDPTQPLQAADKHYVDEQTALDLPLTGGTATGPLTSVKLGALYQVDQFSGADFGAKLSACLSGLSSTNGGTCDARNFTGTVSMGSNLTISTANSAILLPCATISTANQVIVTAGTRNVSLRGCSLRGASTASGSQGGTVFLYSGTRAMVQVGDPTYTADTQGFHLDNVVINTTAATSNSAQGLGAYRTQEMDLESLYFLGNSNQTGMTLDGTGNYTGGTFFDNSFDGFQTAVNAIGHQIANPATTDWMNASLFARLHIDCPTSGGNPISGTYGINLQQGDGNTFSGGDVENCATALHLGPNAEDNTILGLRNENSAHQVVADAGSAFNSWITGGTMYTGELTDNGTRNSFMDTFHRSFNSMNGDWYGSQQDATLTNLYRIGIGAGNERGLLNRYQTDYGYRWTIGLSDATAGQQLYEILDELNKVYRISVGQYNNGQSSTNDQTVINAAGTGAVVLNGSNNSGSGGVVIGSGGATETTVATIDNAGDAHFNGTLQVGGTSNFTGTTLVKNQADAEIDSILQAGATTGQKESFIYRDWNGSSQWYMVKDANNDWALNSATGNLDSFKAFQSTNSGDTYIDASNPSGVVRFNYETGSGTGLKIYGGNSSTLYAGFTGTTAIQFPGLAASSGHNCVQVDNSGYLTNTGSACGTGSGGGSGTVNSGTNGQFAYYNGTGTTLSGASTVPVSAGGTGAATPAEAMANLLPGVTTSGTNGLAVAGNTQLEGTLQVGGTSTFTGSTIVENQADAEIDSILQAGATKGQNESFIYRDWNGSNQWYMMKDASDNWSLNSATGGLDSFKAYQSTNSGDTYINASNASGVVRVNYESGAGSGFNIYGGGSSNLYASFTGANAIRFPGLAASSGHNCVQVDNSGYLTNTGATCGTGSTNGSVNAGTTGQIAYYSGTGTTLSGTNAVPVTAGGTGASTASGALSNLGAAAITGVAFTGPVSIASTLSVMNNASIGPRYDVTQFGAVGNGTTDDTAAIQAAFNACWNNTTEPFGGIVEFPGPHSYIVSSTINAYDGCRIEGTTAGAGQASEPPMLQWNGPVAGSIANITSFTTAANSSTCQGSTYCYSPAFPLIPGSTQNRTTAQIVTVSANNSFIAGQWVDIEGLSTSAGMILNRGIVQIASATNTQFTALVPFPLTGGTNNITYGSYTDTGTATSVNVAVALDASARYQQSVSDIGLEDATGLATNHDFAVGLYFGSRIDTGTYIENVAISGASEYNYYFSGGGINVYIGRGSRSDTAGIAGIYWRAANDNFSIEDSTITNGSSNSSPYNGVAVMLDASQCLSGFVRMHLHNVHTEIASLPAGQGIYTMLDCPAFPNGEQFFVDMEGVWNAVDNGQGVSGNNFSAFAMIPANDAALNLVVLNAQFQSGSGSNTTQRFIGLPTLARNDLTGYTGFITSLSYAPAFKSGGVQSSALDAAESFSQHIGDSNFNQIYQYGIPTSPLLYSDTAYAALPNATTLNAGQILAPPAYWSGSNGKRYALDVVYQTGTTGRPNSGATTCTGTSGTNVITCSSAMDLGVGQRISIGTDTNKAINYVDATNPSAVLVNLQSNLGSTYSTATALTFSAPILGLEMQMPTKSGAAPTTLAWSQGDMEQNSGATANGVAAWVNVAGGTPGTWAGIPLGNGNGQIAPSQISSTTGSGSAVLATSPSVASPTFTGTVTTPLSTAGVVTTTSGGVLGSEATVPMSQGGTGASTAATGLQMLGGAPQNGLYYAVQNGVVCNGVFDYTGAITSGSATLTSTDGAFLNAQVGQALEVDGAGVSGANLHTTIASLTDSNHVQMAAAAGTTIASGALIVYGTDTTSALRTIVNTVVTNGGGKIIMPHGVCVLNQTSTTGTGGYQNAIIPLPYTPRANGNLLPTIEIDGDTMSELGYNEGPGGVSPPSNSGTVIYAMAEPTGSQPSVIGGPTAVSGGHNNNLSVVMKNIGIRTRSNSYSAEDFGWEGNAIVENSTIEVNAAGLSGDAAQPTAANGIILPYSNNDGMVIVRDSFITGYYTGIVASEHALLQNDFLQQMPVCLSMGGGGHLLEIDHSLFQWCPIYIQSVAGSVQDISGILDVEDASSGHWYSPAAAQIISANAGNLCGNLSIEHNEEGVGRLTTLLTTNANVTSCFQQALLDTGSQNVNNLGVFGQATFTPSAGYATTGAGQLGYDSTSNNWHVYDNGADRVMAPLAPGFTSGDCGEPIATGGSWLIADAGAPCGSSSGGGLADPGSNGIVYRSALNITTPATSAEMQTAIGANVYAAAPVLSYNGGDLLCAHAGDLTILSNAITAGTATNLTVASLPSNLKIPGTLVGVTGATSNGGTLNGGPYAITSVSSSTMNFASLPATWSSGGTIYLWCSNQSTDDIASAQYFTNNTYAATLSAGQSLSQDYQVNTYTTATAPTYTIDYEMGSTLLYGSGAQTLSASAGGQNVPGDIKFNLISPATGWTSTTLDHLLLGQNTPTSKIYAGNFLNNIATGALKLGGFFSATGLGSITSGSGGTISGTGTCMLGTFNDSLTGATATVTFVTSGSWTGATFAVTNTGYGATAAPTSATLASGTATCSGTPTLVTVLGGAQGNAVQLQTVKITQ